MNLQDIQGIDNNTPPKYMIDMEYKGVSFSVFINKSDRPNMLYVHIIVPAGADPTIEKDFIENIQDRLNSQKRKVHMRIYARDTIEFWANDWSEL